MKTAISIPAETFEDATQRARDLGISRSEFFATAAKRYIEYIDAESTTRQINEVLNKIGQPDESNEFAVAIGHRVLSDIDDLYD